MNRTRKIAFGCGAAVVAAGICAVGLDLRRKKKRSIVDANLPERAEDRPADGTVTHGMGRARKIIFRCSIAVMILGICVIVQDQYRQKRNFAIYEELPNQVVTWAAMYRPAKPPPDNPVPDELTPDELPYRSPIDFETLWEINPDIYAWIEVPGTNVSYPVVQHPKNDAYYLNHTIEGKRGLPGSIYTEPSVNGKDFSDYNTIIYGHNMRVQGTMFNGLIQLRDAAFLEEHREVVIYTPDTEFHYQIFAAVTYENVYIPYYYDDDTEAGRQEYLDSIMGIRERNSRILKDVEVTKESHLLTLSTCVQNVSQRLEKRFLVVAVRLEDGVSVEGVAE